MFDTRLRTALGPGLDSAGRRLAARGIRAGHLTAAGWAAGVGACVAAATGHWDVALVLWLTNRLLDGLDGPVARATRPTRLGGFLDVVADFSIYGGFVAAVAVAEPQARLACVVLLATYYVSGTALLALSSLQDRSGAVPPAADRRELRLTGGLAEGTETIAVYALFCLFPGHVEVIAWSFAVVVGITAVQRVVSGILTLRARPSAARGVDDAPAPHGQAEARP